MLSTTTTRWAGTRSRRRGVAAMFNYHDDGEFGGCQHFVRDIFVTAPTNRESFSDISARWRRAVGLRGSIGAVAFSRGLRGFWWRFTTGLGAVKAFTATLRLSVNVLTRPVNGPYGLRSRGWRLRSRRAGGIMDLAVAGTGRRLRCRWAGEGGPALPYTTTGASCGDPVARGRDHRLVLGR